MTSSPGLAPEVFDAAEITRALTLLIDPGAVAELRAPKTRKGTIVGYTDQLPLLIEGAKKLSAYKPPAVYVTLNPVRRDCAARAWHELKEYADFATKDEEIVSRRWLLVDCDATRPKGVNATDAERLPAIAKAFAIRDWLCERGWPPGIVADSGNGGHYLVRVDLPNDKASAALLSHVLQALARRFDDAGVTVDTATFNASRVCKLYGTVTAKGCHVPELGRVFRRARLLEVPELLEAVTGEQLAELAGEVKTTEPKPRPSSHKPAGSLGAGDYTSLDTRRWFEAHGALGRELEPGKFTVLCPWSGEHSNDTDADDSDTVIWAANGASWGGFHCSHAHCIGHRDLKAVMSLWGDADQFCEREFKSSTWPAGNVNPRTVDVSHTTEDAASETARIASLADELVACAENDSGNAERLARRFGDRLRWSAQHNFVVWDSRRWAASELEPLRFTKETGAAIYHEAALLAGKEAKERAAWAVDSGNAARRKAMLGLVRAEPGIGIAPSQLDADRLLLNVFNGTIDLRTGELRPHRREDLLTKLAPVVYDPEARSERWERFIEQATGGDADLAAFLQRAAGYSLTGDTTEEVLFFMHGPAKSGKSTFMEALRATLGEYAATADFETFIAQKNNSGPRNDVARLANSRLVASIEVDEGKRLAEGLIKTLTGGDTVTARFLYKEAFEFEPQFKLWLVANHAPRVRDDDEAMWRRILRIPFENVVPKHARDNTLKAFLRDPLQAGPAILAWAVRGCLEWQRIGLSVPSVVETATNNYRRDQDPLQDFFADCCVLVTGAWTPAGELWSVYERWARENGERRPLGRRQFTTRLTDHGCFSERRGAAMTRGWSGIGLMSEDRCEGTDATDATDISLRDFDSTRGERGKLLILMSDVSVASGSLETTPEDEGPAWYR